MTESQMQLGVLLMGLFLLCGIWVGWEAWGRQLRKLESRQPADVSLESLQRQHLLVALLNNDPLNVLQRDMLYRLVDHHLPAAQDSGSAAGRRGGSGMVVRHGG